MHVNVVVYSASLPTHDKQVPAACYSSVVEQNLLPFQQSPSVFPFTHQYLLIHTCMYYIGILWEDDSDVDIIMLLGG